MGVRRVGLLLIGLGFVGMALPAFDVSLKTGDTGDWVPVIGLGILLAGVLALWEGIRREGGLELIDPRSWRRFQNNRGAVAGAILVVVVLLIGFCGPMIAPHPPDHIYDAGFGTDGAPIAPNTTFWFGADSIGRDQLSRLLYGGRVSLAVALGAVSIAGTLGFAAGLLSGYFRGFLDLSLMRLVDFILSLPFLLVAIAVNRVIEDPALWTLCLLLGLLSWTTLGRVTRAKTLQARELEYVQAARALGAGHARIILRHILPNVLGPAIVIATTMIANMIIVESAMSFLGLGVRPPTASWGSMLRDGQEYLQVIPRLMLVPGALIVATVFGFNLLGEGLRDALDPKE